MKARLFLCVTVLAASSMTAAFARADDAPPAPPADRGAAAAEALFRDGRAKMEAGDYVHACPLFAESLRLDGALGTLFNLATCEEDMGKLADAWERYGEVVDRMPDTDERRVIAAEHKAALTRQLPWLTVVLSPAAPPGTHVTQDGVELAGPSLGVPLPVDPGRHEVIVRAPGCAPRIFVVELAKAQRRLLSVEAGTPGGEASAGPVPLARSSGPTRTRTAGYVVGGAGLAAIAVGTVLGVRALGRRSDSEADCTGSVCRDASGIQAYSDARTLAVAADVAFGVGAIAIATGAYLTWLAPGVRSTGLRVTPGGVGGSF
ncbi:MAG TPA: hypothetical protein VIY73_22150 [Polyangiaceae bacterium]